MNDFFSFLKNKSRVILVILFLMIASVFVYFIIGEFYRAYINREINKTQEELKKIEEEIERAKKFDEEKYAEKITSILEPESYFSTSTDIELEGVEIIPKGDRKLVINHAEGYQLEIPKDLILNQTRNTRALNFDSIQLINSGMRVSDWSVMGIFVYRQDREPDLYQEFLQWALEDIKGTTTEVEDMRSRVLQRTESEEIYIDGRKFYKVIYWAKDVYDYIEENGEIKQVYNPHSPNRGWWIDNIAYIYINNGVFYKIITRSQNMPEYIEKTFKFIK